MKNTNETATGSILRGSFMDNPFAGRPNPNPFNLTAEEEKQEKKDAITLTGEKAANIPGDKTITISKDEFRETAIKAALHGNAMDNAAEASPIVALAVGLSAMMIVDQMVVELFGGDDETGGAE